MRLLMEWLTPEDGLPDDFEEVLICTDKGGVFTGFCLVDGSCTVWSYSSGVEVKDMVTYWMTIPIHPDQTDMTKEKQHGMGTGSLPLPC